MESNEALKLKKFKTDYCPNLDCLYHNFTGCIMFAKYISRWELALKNVKETHSFNCKTQQEMDEFKLELLLRDLKFEI